MAGVGRQASTTQSAIRGTLCDMEDIEAAVEFARNTEGPVLLEFMVEKEEIVYPMVPAGADLHDMKRRPKPGEK